MVCASYKYSPRLISRRKVGKYDINYSTSYRQNFKSQRDIKTNALHLQVN